MYLCYKCFLTMKHNAYICGKQLVMAQMNLTPLDDVLDKHFGKVGTSKRDAFESDVDQALHAYRVGEACLSSKLKEPFSISKTALKLNV